MRQMFCNVAWHIEGVVFILLVAQLCVVRSLSYCLEMQYGTANWRTDGHIGGGLASELRFATALNYLRNCLLGGFCPCLVDCRVPSLQFQLRSCLG